MGILGDIKSLANESPFPGIDSIDSLKDLKASDVSLSKFQEALSKHSAALPDFASLVTSYKEELTKLPMDSSQLSEHLLSQISIQLDGQISGFAEEIKKYVANLDDLKFPDISFSGGNGTNLFDSFPDGETILSFLKTLKDLIANFSGGFLDTGFLSLIEWLLQSLKSIGTNALGSSFSVGKVTDSLEDALDLIKKALSSVSFESINKHLQELEKLYNFDYISQLIDEYSTQLASFNKIIVGGKLPTNSFMDELIAKRDLLNEEVKKWEKRLSEGPLEQLATGIDAVSKFIDGPMKAALPKIDPAGWKIGKVDTSQLSTLLHTDQLQEGVNAIHATLDIGIEKIDELQFDTVQGALDQLNGSLADLNGTTSSIIQTGGAELSDMLTEPVAQLNQIIEEVDQLLQNFQDDLKDGFEGFFQPVRTVLSDGINVASQTLDHLDIGYIRQQLVELLMKVKDLLTNQEVLQTIQTFDNAIQTVGRVRFTPVTRRIIAALETITKTLRVIKMVPLTKSVTKEIEKLTKDLPEDLSPLTNRLLKEVRTLILEIEDLPALTELAGISDKIRSEVDRLDPKEYITSNFSAPFESFQTKAGALDLKLLIGPLEDEIADFKKKLRPSLDTSEVKEKMDAAFADFLKNLDDINPDDLGKKIGEQINESVQSMTSQLPVNALSEVLTDASESFSEGLQGMTSGVIEFFSLIDKKLEELEDNEQDVKEVIDDIINKIEELNATLPLDQWLDRIKPTLSEIITFVKEPIQKVSNLIKENPLREKIDLLQANIDGMPSDALLSLGTTPKELKIRSFVESTPESAFKLKKLHTDLDGITSSIDGIQSKMENWVELLQDTSVDHLETLDTFLKDAGWRYLTSISLFFFESVRQLRKIVGDLKDGLVQRVSELQTNTSKIEAIAASLNETASILSDLKLIDVQVIDQEINKVIDGLKRDITQLNPSQLLSSLDEMIEDLLQNLTLTELLNLSGLQEKYNGLVDKLDDKHPDKWIDASVDSQLDALKDLTSKYDLSKLTTTLIDVLRSLERQLSKELNRTTVSYAEMQAVLKSEPVKIPIKLPKMKVPKLEAPKVKVPDKIKKLKAKF